LVGRRYKGGKLKKDEEGEKETSSDHPHMNCLLIFLF